MGIISNAQEADNVINLTGPDGKQMTLRESDLEDMDHAKLLNLREHNLDNKEVQTLLAPYEHQAFAREATKENIAMAVPIALATPIYAAAKSIGAMTDNTTTRPSLEQVGRGLKGVGQGIIANIIYK